jgi:hypothetical protein
LLNKRRYFNSMETQRVASLRFKKIITNGGQKWPEK